MNYLQIPESRWGRYLNTELTVHDWMSEISHYSALVPPPRLRQINDWMDQKNKLVYWKLGLMGGLVVLAGLVPPVYSVGTSTLVYIFSSLGLVPAAGFFLAVFAFLSTLFPNTFSLFSVSVDEDNTFYDRFKKNFFSLLRFTFNGLAYGFLYAAVTSNPLIGGLFVIAAVAEVVQQAFNWIMHPEPRKKIIATEPLDRLYEQECNARKRVDYLKQRNTIMINFAEALLYTAIVAFSCFVPGGFIITLASIALIGAVMLIKNRVEVSNSHWAETALDRKFKRFETEYEKKTGRQYHLANKVEKNTAWRDAHFPWMLDRSTKRTADSAPIEEQSPAVSPSNKC